MSLNLEFIGQLKKLRLQTHKRTVSNYSGARRSIEQGRGIEPVDHREYFPGDDIRFIDWKVYGRTEKLFIRRFEEDKNLTTHVLVDSSKSMDFSSDPKKYPTKFDYAAMIAAGFIFLALNSNEKFAISNYNKKLLNPMQPMRGQRHFFSAIDLLNKEVPEGVTDFRFCASQYVKLIRSKALVVVISDFLQPLEALEAGILRLSRKTNNLLMIHVADPIEMNLDWQGDMKLIDLETRRMKTTFFTPSMRKQYIQSFKNHIEGINAVCDDVGAFFYSFSTDTPVFDIFFEITNSSNTR